MTDRETVARWLNRTYGFHLFEYTELDQRSADSQAEWYASADELLSLLSAPSELARLRPVVEAAEALVKHWDAAEQASADYIVRNGKLLYALAAKVKEAQR